MKRIAIISCSIILCLGALFWFLTRPAQIGEPFLSAMRTGDPQKGELVFWAGGCSSCHAVKGASGPAKLVLTGGRSLKTPFGTFYVPNISPDKSAGIGTWSGADFANAMINGVSPQGRHYYPAFPYASYARMTPVDIADLWAYLKILPAAGNKNIAHDLPLPFRFRRGLGLWKLAFLNDDPIAEIARDDPILARGQYLVEGRAHCGECHTPRNLAGGIDSSRWLGGGPAPEGKGRIPNITPDKTGIGEWTAADIEYSLETGFTPAFDSFGSSMAEVQENMAKLPKSDREAIAAYLKSIAPVESAPKK